MLTPLSGVSRFFEAFDNNRESLAAAYAPLCTFSFFTDTAHPVRTKAKKIGGHSDKKFPNQYKLDWKMYLTSEGSRNLSRVKNAAKRVATLKVTPEDVIKAITALPKTSHPLSEGEKFVFDAWTVPGLVGASAENPEGETVIYAVVQGQFTECKHKTQVGFWKGSSFSIFADDDTFKSHPRGFVPSAGPSSSPQPHQARRKPDLVSNSTSRPPH